MKKKTTMNMLMLLALLTLSCLWALPAGDDWGNGYQFGGDVLFDEDPDWRELRKDILMGDLQTMVGLTEEQMIALEDLALTLKEDLIAKVEEIHAIREQIRELAPDWQSNFEEIIHLQFQIEVKEVEIRGLYVQFREDVLAVLTEAQLEYAPFVLHIMDEAYHLHPKKPPVREQNQENNGPAPPQPGPRR